MQRAETLTIEQIERFLGASEEVRLRALDREEIYSWVVKMERPVLRRSAGYAAKR
jgi:hypothetical protein